MTVTAMIRPAQPHEAAALGALALRSKAHWGYTAEFMAACRDELALSPADVAADPTFVLEQEGRVLGFYRLERVRGDTAELGHLFVEPAAIGCGHGRALFAHACAEARRCGYATLLVQSDPHADAFYRSVGARRIGSRESASIPGRQLPLLEVSLAGAAAAGGGM